MPVGPDDGLDHDSIAVVPKLLLTIRLGTLEPGGIQRICGTLNAPVPLPTCSRAASAKVDGPPPRRPPASDLGESPRPARPSPIPVSPFGYHPAMHDLCPHGSPPGFSTGDQHVFFTSSEDLSFLPERSIKFFMTSPPYWNLKDYGTEAEIGKEDYDTYLDRMNLVWQECYRLAVDDSVMIINVANRRHRKRFYPIGLDIAARMKGWQLWDIVMWYIPNGLPQPNHYMERLFDNKYEFLFVFTKDGSTNYEFHKPRVPQKYITADPRQNKRNPRGRCLGNIIRVPAYRPPNVKKLGYHVAAYPEELVALMLHSYTSEGDLILDPFLGSGTTLKVARGMERRGIGIELNSSFRSLIEQRINEPFELPDWRDLDIIHSTTTEPGTTKPRKIHLLRQTDTEQGSLEGLKC